MPHNAKSAWRAPAFVPLFCATLLGGCASSALDRAPLAPDRPWQPNVTSAGEIVPGPAKPSTPAPQGYVLPANPALASLPQAPSIDPAKTYDLADLIDLAQANNPDTRIAWNAARNAALAAGIARSSYLPQLTASALGIYQASTGHSSLQNLGVDNDESATGTISAISMKWLLFDFGERAAVIEGADQETIVANIRFTAAHQELIHVVSLAFYGHAAARARADIAVQSWQDAQEIEKAAQERYKRGIGTVMEVAQAQQATAQANLAQTQAMGDRQDSYISLLTAMGLSPLVKIQIADVSGHKLAPSLGVDVEEIVSSALARRPDVLAAYSTLKASLANVRAARAELLPKFFMSGSGAYTTGDIFVTSIPGAAQNQSPTLNLSTRRLGATILAGVTFPLYDGRARESSLRQARIRADTADLALARVKENAVQQIALAGNTLRTSLATHEAAGALLTATQTSYNAALAAYRRGVGSATDVLVARRQLLEARIASSDSYSAALSAAATLALASGSLGSAP